VLIGDPEARRVATQSAIPFNITASIAPLTIFGSEYQLYLGRVCDYTPFQSSPTLLSTASICIAVVTGAISIKSTR
jgi:hypothetical protein